MFGNRVYGIDLGSHMIKIYSQKHDRIVKERNMIAIRNQEHLLAIGDEAYQMFEKNPPNVEVVSTMADGVIANISYLEVLLNGLLEKTARHVGRKPTIFIAVPVNMTEIEKRAFYSVAQRGRFRKSKVFLVEKPIVDALALGIPILKTKGSMIVNIGAATTEISVIADSRVIISKIIPLGGNQFDQEIMDHIRKKNSFFVSQRTAGRLKVAMSDLKSDKKTARKIVGIDCVSGLPKERVVTSATINESILNSMDGIIEEIKTFLERTPPQIHNAILQEGIYLTGGSTHIPNIHRLISEEVGCPVLLSKYYELCTIYGLKEFVTHKALHHWAFIPKKQK